MICDKCKKFFASGNRRDGIPNGVSMVMKNRKAITLCSDCVISIQQMNAEQKEAFFKELKGDTK